MVTHPGTKHYFDNISLTLATTPPCTLSAILRSHHAALLDSLSVRGDKWTPCHIPLW